MGISFCDVSTLGLALGLRLGVRLSLGLGLGFMRAVYEVPDHQ